MSNRSNWWDTYYQTDVVNQKLVEWSPEKEAFFKPWFDLCLLDKVPLEPGEGWEFLPHGSKPEDGDEFWMIPGQRWHKSGDYHAGNKIHGLAGHRIGPYRRRIKVGANISPPTAKTVHPMCESMSQPQKFVWLTHDDHPSLSMHCTNGPLRFSSRGPGVTLPPCPKCGGEPILRSNRDGFGQWSFVQCTGCGRRTWTSASDIHAMNEWKTDAVMPSPAAGESALRKLAPGDHVDSMSAAAESAPISPEVPQAQRRSLPNAVTQTTPTNCFSACVATVLGIPITEVPLACDGAWWDWDAFQEWLAGHGMQAIEMTFENGGTLYPVRRAVRCILTGPSPRECSTGRHAIVGDFIGLDGFELLHDPNESQMWLDGEPTHAVFFVHLKSPAAAESPPISAEEPQAPGLTTPATPSAAAGASGPGAGSFSLECGKRYVRRNGTVSGLITATASGHPCEKSHPFFDPVEGLTFRRNGKYMAEDSVHPRDLIAEYHEPEPSPPAESPDDWVTLTDPDHVIRKCDQISDYGTQWYGPSDITAALGKYYKNCGFKLVRCRRKDLPVVPVVPPAMPSPWRPMTDDYPRDKVLWVARDDGLVYTERNPDDWPLAKAVAWMPAVTPLHPNSAPPVVPKTRTVTLREYRRVGSLGRLWTTSDLVPESHYTGRTCEVEVPE